MSTSKPKNIPRKRKFAPDPPTPETYLLERVEYLENEVRLLRQNLQVPTVHTFDRSQYIDATQGEMFWDHKNQRSYVFHHDYYRPTQPPTYHIKVFHDEKAVTAGDGKFKFKISRDMGGWTPPVGEPYPSFYLYDAEAYVTTAGSCTISLTNDTKGVDMLSSPLVITSLNDTGTRVIHPTNSLVDWEDHVWINVDSAGGMGLGVILVFNPVLT